MGTKLAAFSLCVAICASPSASADEEELTPETAHPAIAGFVDVSHRWQNKPLTKDEIAGLLRATNVNKTSRGDNVKVFAAAVDRNVRILVPIVLEHCGAPKSAARLKALSPIRDAATLDKAQDVMGEVGDAISDEMKATPRSSQLAYACSDGAPGILTYAGTSTGEMSTALRQRKEKINDEPEYARFAGHSASRALSQLVVVGVDRGIVLREAQAMLLALTKATGASGAPEKPQKKR